MTKDVKGAALFGVGFVIGVAIGNWLLSTVRRSV